MVWWPIGRDRRAPAPGPAPAGPQPIASGTPPEARPEEAWRDLPPVQRTLAVPLTPVAPLDAFTGSLATFRDPSFLAPLSHQVDPRAGGVVEGLADLAPGPPQHRSGGSDLAVLGAPATPPRVQRRAASEPAADYAPVDYAPTDDAPVDDAPTDDVPVSPPPSASATEVASGSEPTTLTPDSDGPVPVSTAPAGDPAPLPVQRQTSAPEPHVSLAPERRLSAVPDRVPRTAVPPPLPLLDLPVISRRPAPEPEGFRPEPVEPGRPTDAPPVAEQTAPLSGFAAAVSTWPAGGEAPASGGTFTEPAGRPEPVAPPVVLRTAADFPTTRPSLPTAPRPAVAIPRSGASVAGPGPGQPSSTPSDSHPRARPPRAQPRPARPRQPSPVQPSPVQPSPVQPSPSSPAPSSADPPASGDDPAVQRSAHRPAPLLGRADPRTTAEDPLEAAPVAADTGRPPAASLPDDELPELPVVSRSAAALGGSPVRRPQAGPGRGDGMTERTIPSAGLLSPRPPLIDHPATATAEVVQRLEYLPVPGPDASGGPPARVRVAAGSAAGPGPTLQRTTPAGIAADPVVPPPEPRAVLPSGPVVPAPVTSAPPTPGPRSEVITGPAEPTTPTDWSPENGIPGASGPVVPLQAWTEVELPPAQLPTPVAAVGRPDPSPAIALQRHSSGALTRPAATGPAAAVVAPPVVLRQRAGTPGSSTHPSGLGPALASGASFAQLFDAADPPFVQRASEGEPAAVPETPAARARPRGVCDTGLAAGRLHRPPARPSPDPRPPSSKRWPAGSTSPSRPGCEPSSGWIANAQGC